MSDFKEHMLINRLRSIANIVIVGSGKGGVGKSTLTSIIALRLRELGKDVGVLDMDLHGSSIPFILGRSEGKVEVVKGGFKPIEVHGIKVMSLRLFVGDKPAPLRGDRKSEVIKYLLSLTIWGDLNYLLIDLPPGMSDELLTLTKYVKGKHILITIPTRTSMDVLVKYVKLLDNLRCIIPAIVINNLLNIKVNYELISNYMNEIASIINRRPAYVVMPFIDDVEELLAKGLLPDGVIDPIDSIIKYI